MAELLLSIPYFLLAYLGFKARNLSQRVQQIFTIYAFLSGMWMLGQFAAWQKLLPIGNEWLALWLPDYGALLLWVTFLALGMVFLPLGESERPWLWVGLGWAAAVLGLIFLRIAGSPGVSPATGGRDPLIFSLILMGWLLLAVRAVILPVRAFKVARRPMHRNRIFFWGLVLSLVAVGDGAIFLGRSLPGASLHLIGMLVCVYVLLFHRLFDFIQATLRLFTFLVVSLTGVVLYAGLYAWLYSQAGLLPGDNPMIFGLVLGALLIFLANPLVSLFHRWLNRLMLDTGYRPEQIVREYSLAISNLVDMDALAATVLGLIRKNFVLGVAYMYMVSEEHQNGQTVVCLRLLHADGGALEGAQSQGLLSIASPVVTYLRQARRPLTQYDLDLLAEFRTVPPAERAWLDRLDVDLYVPIYDRTGWIGLLALGPKNSGAPYSDEEINLLATLADQTTVALVNTRHFAELSRLNNDLTRASHALQQANQQLQEMDQLKSGFIGVITHELRTPFANMGFALQLLQMYSRERLTPEQREQLEQLAQSIQTGRMMIDNLVLYASFISRQIQVAYEPLDISELFKTALPPLKAQAVEKGVNFHLDILGELRPIRGDRKLLANAIHQLVHNAIKFTPHKGNVWISCWMTSSEFVLDVKDSGVGIHPEQMAVMWSSFTQAADQLRRGLEGLGLGLALVKSIVEAHGGQVWAESQPGAGSTFGFRLPLQEPGEKPALPAEKRQN